MTLISSYWKLKELALLEKESQELKKKIEERATQENERLIDKLLISQNHYAYQISFSTY